MAVIIYLLIRFQKCVDVDVGIDFIIKCSDNNEASVRYLPLFIKNKDSWGGKRKRIMSLGLCSVSLIIHHTKSCAFHLLACSFM